MPAWAAPTVTNVTAVAGRVAGDIFKDVKERLAGQGNLAGTTPAGTAYAAVTGQTAFMNLGTVRDSNGNLAEVFYDPNANIIYTVAK